jgi:hypothetical protein
MWLRCVRVPGRSRHPSGSPTRWRRPPARPGTSSSPWMRRYPHPGFSLARRRMRARIERTVRGRGERFGRERAVWRRARRSRCRRITVSGRTSSRTPRSTSVGNRRSNAARNARSPGATALSGRRVGAPVPRSDGEERPCHGRSSAAGAAGRTRSSHPDRPVAAARPAIMPGRSPVARVPAPRQALTCMDEVPGKHNAP